MMTDDEILAVIQAHKEGKQIEWRHVKNPDVWTLIQPHHIWRFEHFNYRVKPGPKLRPWTLKEVPIGAVIRGGWGRAVLTHTAGKGELALMCAPDETDKGRRWYVCQSHDIDCEYSVDCGKTWKPCGVVA